MNRAQELAERFHETYERLAPQFGYETRTETRKFEPTTPNGRLMVAVCAELLAAQQEPTFWIDPADIDGKEGPVYLYSAKSRHAKDVPLYAGPVAQQEADKTCVRCGGSGSIDVVVGGGPYGEEDTVQCPECGGTGAIPQQEAGEPVAHKALSDLKSWLACTPGTVGWCDLRYSSGVIALLGDDRARPTKGTKE